MKKSIRNRQSCCSFRASCSHKLKTFFSLIELLVVISIISILTSLLLPALKKAKARTYIIACANNLRQISLGFQNYLFDQDEYFPWCYKPVGPSSSDWDPWINWIATLSDNGTSDYGLNYLPGPYDRWPKPTFNESSPWICPAMSSTMFTYIASGANNWQMIVKYGLSYSYPIYKNDSRWGLGGGRGWGSGASSIINCPNSPPKIMNIKTPSTVMNLCESGTNSDTGGGCCIGIVPSYPTAMGRHYNIGGGTNLLFVDGHVTYFKNGMELLSQWVRGATGSPCQLDYPFNVDLK